jgi:hypothetical protein
MVNKTPFKASLIASLALVASVAVAAPQNNDARHRYKWHDAQGNLLLEDSIPPEDAKLGYDIVNANGLVVKHVDRQKTEEELAAAKAAKEKTEADKRAAAEQASRDTQLLAAYPNEADLRKAQESQLTMVTQNIDTAQAGIKSQEKSLSEMLGHAAELERDGKPVPKNYQNQIAKLKGGIAEQKGTLEKRERERESMQKQFQVELAHYREVKERAETQRKAAEGK